MPDYKRMYITLFQAVTNAIDGLQSAQQEAESIYVESGESPMVILDQIQKQKQGTDE